MLGAKSRKSGLVSFIPIYRDCALRPRAAQGREAAGFPEMSGLTVNRFETSTSSLRSERLDMSSPTCLRVEDSRVAAQPWPRPLAQTWFAMLSLCCLISRNTTAIATFTREVAPGQAGL